MNESKYSDDGPICPVCDREFVPDEGSWFESGPVDCDQCETRFYMEVENNPLWRTYLPEPKDQLNTEGER